MYIAICDTSSFEWVALGNSEDEAQIAMIEAWHLHEEQYEKATGQTIDMVGDYFDAINVHEIQPGQCLRDGVENTMK